MAIKAIFYDLDGTLLPMDMDEFTGTYFGFLAKKMKAHGYEKDDLVSAIWGGTKCMVLNDGKKTNDEVFWDYFLSKYGEEAEKDIPLFEDFYRNEFDNARSVVHFDERVPKLIEKVKDMGLRQILATNPLFPEVATKKRIAWAGLNEDDFETFTTYENSHFCKPNLKYYEELLEKQGLKPEECLMVGNDVDEDMVAERLGMKVFLITKFMLNKSGKNIEVYPHGDFDDLYEYISFLAG